MARQADTILFDAAPWALLVVDARTGTVVQANPRAAELFDDSLRLGPGGAHAAELFDDRGRAMIQRLLEGDGHDCRTVVAAANAPTRELLAACSRADQGDAGVLVIGLIPVDEAAAISSGAVGGGRGALLDVLARHVAACDRPSWLLFADVDRFRALIGEVGHVEADAVLGSIADRISCALGSDDMLVRFGADEFVCVVRGEDAEDVARAVVTLSGEPHQAGSKRVKATLSVGVTQVHAGEPMEDAVRRAELAARAAKADGRARYRMYDPALAREADEETRLTSALRAALEHGELVLHYQPVIDIAKRAIVGGEALIRWERPGAGMVMPGEFIQVAERSGVIADIGAWVMREACRQLRLWDEEGMEGLWISVNVSARQLKTGEVVDQLRAVLKETAVRPGTCVLEVTETALMEDPDTAFEVLRDVHALGARVALDDFGTGYSSLSRMRDMPFNELKIDRSFLRRIDTHARDAALVAAMVALAHSFESSAIAEGVETADQLSYLKALKCDMAQGFVFSRPVPPSGFAQLWRHGSAWLAL